MVKISMCTDLLIKKRISDPSFSQCNFYVRPKGVMKRYGKKIPLYCLLYRVCSNWDGYVKKNIDFLLKSICCWYTLEALQNASNEQHDKRFHVEIRKISLFFSSLKKQLFLCHEF